MDSPDDSRQDDGMGSGPRERAVCKLRRSVFDFVHLLVKGAPFDNESGAGAALCARMCQLPSEALPIQCGLGGEEAACLLQEGNKITLVLRRRSTLCLLHPAAHTSYCALAGKTSRAAVASHGGVGAQSARYQVHASECTPLGSSAHRIRQRAQYIG